MFNKKIVKVLKDKSGISLVLVLCVTLFLLSICTSVLVAASSAASTESENWNYSQLTLYSDSVAKSLTHSMQAKEKDPDLANGNLKHLGSKFAEGLAIDEYDEKNGNAVTPGRTRFEYKLAPEFKNTTADFTVSDIDVFVVDRSIDVQEAIPAQPDIINPDGSITPGTPAVPATIEIGFAKLEFIYDVTTNDKTVKTVLSYELSDAEFEEKTVGAASKYIIIDQGKWGLVGNERIDSGI